MTARARAPVALAVLLVAGLVLTAVALRPSSGTRRIPAGVAFAAQSPRYEVLYQVDHLSPGGQTRTWELLTVDRPFRVRDATFRAPPAPGDRPVGGTLTTADRLYSLSPNGIQDVSARQPGLGTEDQDLLGVVGEAARRGLAQPRGPGAVAGRACQVYRFRDPPAGPLGPLTGSEHDDLCIDPAGIVLREDWVRAGALVVSRQAQRVDLEPAGIDATLSPAGALPPPNGTASAASLAPGQPVDTFLADPPAPAGFELRDRERFAFPDPETPQILVYGSVVWTFVRGTDVVTVEAASGRPDVSPVPGNTKLGKRRLPGLGDAASVVRSDGFEIDAVLNPGRWVRVRGTVPLPELTAYAGRLPRPSP